MLDPAVGQLPDTLAEQGRGIALGRAAVDEVGYERTGATNRCPVVQRRTAS